MSKSVGVIATIIVVVVLALGGWYLVSNHNKTNPYASNSSNSNNMSNMNSSNNSQHPTATNAVTIQNYSFTPADITVKQGTTVTWTNKDSVAHTVTETDGQTGPSSSDVNPGATYTFTFSKAGTYHYHCSIHPEMVGTVTVTT
jgi:plastocyanin